MSYLDKNKVIVGMSGGVDSSVAAALLVERGFNVAGITITPFKIDSGCRILENERSCCSYKSVLDAADVCASLGIEHYLIDLTDAFRSQIVDNFINEYMSGRTPNPCVQCNPAIKWGGMLKKAEELGAYYVATGHYAKIVQNGNSNNFSLAKGTDLAKDQSYFLWKLSNEELKRTIFPLSHLTKPETRAIAEKYNFVVHNKPESQEICFIPYNDYHKFLKKEVPEVNDIGEGEIVMEGEVVGKHQGFPYYTVGQRKGLGVTHAEPLYVKKIEAKENRIVIDTEKKLYSKGLIAENVNLIGDVNLEQPRKLLVKIRYRDKGEEAYCRLENALLNIDFINERRAVTPGQSVVMYDGDVLVGGGVIRESY